MRDQPRHCCPSLQALPSAIAGQNAGHAVGRQIVMEVVVDLNRRRPAAGADALDFFEREDAVGRHALVADAQLFLEALVNVVPPRNMQLMLVQTCTLYLPAGLKRSIE